MRKGFTLIELLIVIAILGILSSIGVSNFMTARIKAKDTARKSDLQTIAKSLEAYANDHRTYPLSDASGQIICKADNETCAWGALFVDDKDTIYVAKLPSDPANFTYRYTSNGTSYTLYAHLENNKDPSRDLSITQTCGSNAFCNYKITSTNL